MLCKQAPASAAILPGMVGPRLGQDLDPMTALVDSDQADTQQTAKPMHAPVPVATAPGFRDRKPKLVGDTQPVDCLEH